MYGYIVVFSLAVDSILYLSHLPLYVSIHIYRSINLVSTLLLMFPVCIGVWDGTNSHFHVFNERYPFPPFIF